MFKTIKTTLNPACYHGFGKKAPFFEGWYFKLIDATGKKRLAVIPGIFLSNDSTNSQAFVQIFDGSSGEVRFLEYPTTSFQSANGIFDISIGNNRFSSDTIKLDIERDNFVLKGELLFTDLKPWPVKFLSPGIMGWYAWAPFMQCYHGVVSLDHRIDGHLTMNDTQMDFSGGRGYIEKDWGRSFPECWVWFQSNHFTQPGTSITASTAIIPWIRGAFPGFIIGFRHDEQLYRFATYTGAKIEKLEMGSETIHWVVKDRRHCLEMIAHRSSNSGLLHAPTRDGMSRRIPEVMDTRIDVRLSTQLPGKKQVIFEGTGLHAGMETVGQLDKLIEMWRRERAKKIM